MMGTSILENLKGVKPGRKRGIKVGVRFPAQGHGLEVRSQPA